jgi:hypothetical protein
MPTKALPSGIGVYRPNDCISKVSCNSENALTKSSDITRYEPRAGRGGTE